MDRRKKGSGQITHVPGRKSPWRASVVDSTGKQKSRFFKTEKEAKAFLREVNADANKLKSLLETGVTFSAFSTIFLEEKSKQNLKPTAYRALADSVDRANEYVGRVLLRDIDSDMVQQMIYDLAATKLPAHAYTKEALFVKQFGLTGVKINMSLIPAVAEGGIAAGLDAKGNYVWAGESFNYDEAVEIQNAEGYSENCGTICVGVSKQHIEKLLRDPNIRMVIPYHKSGLNPIVAHMNKIAEFTDYTTLKTNPGGCQNTIDKNGSKEIRNRHGVTKAEKGHFDKAGVSYKRYVREFKFEDAENYSVKDEIKADIFAAGDKIDATAVSKGKGFQGAIKRYGQHRGPMTHGSKFHRHQGSNGSSSDPSRVFKGKGMPGHMGAKQITIQNLEVVRVDAENNLILVKGAVPGPKKSLVTLKETVKSAK